MAVLKGSMAAALLRADKNTSWGVEMMDGCCGGDNDGGIGGRSCTLATSSWDASGALSAVIAVVLAAIEESTSVVLFMVPRGLER